MSEEIAQAGHLLTLRDWDGPALAAQAKEHGRSMEAEVRDILTKVAWRPHIGIALLAAAQDVGGVEDLRIPMREDLVRAVEFE